MAIYHSWVEISKLLGGMFGELCLVCLIKLEVMFSSTDDFKYMRKYFYAILVVSFYCEIDVYFEAYRTGICSFRTLFYYTYIFLIFFYSSGLF